MWSEATESFFHPNLIYFRLRHNQTITSKKIYHILDQCIHLVVFTFIINANCSSFYVVNVGKNKIFHYSLEYNAKPTIILQSKKKKLLIFHTRDRRVKGLKSKFERENVGKSQQGISKIKLKWDLTSEFFVFFVS